MRGLGIFLAIIMVLSVTAQVDQSDHIALDTFIENSLDSNVRRFDSMDQVYYTAMTLSYLEELMDVPVAYESTITALKQQILDFINESRNQDGGYGNWKSAISSMESTYQAILVLDAYGEPIENVNQTLSFLQRLLVDNGGYYPLLNWDAPDVTSSVRALKLKTILDPSINLSRSDPDLPAFFESTYDPPLFILGGSGYGELNSSKAELLSSRLVLEGYSLMGLSDPHVANVAEYIQALQSPNGGIAGEKGKLPTTGFTAAGIDYYILLYNDSKYNVDNYLPRTYLDNAVNYLLSNRVGASGFKTSERGSSPSLASTFFAIRTLRNLQNSGLIDPVLDYTGALTYILSTVTKTYGYGGYPGDTPSLTDTARALLIKRMLGDNSSSTLTRDYVLSAFDQDTGGFGFRPGASARVKYTYYGMIATRLLGIEFADVNEIIQFIVSAQTDLGGFSQIAEGRVPYVSHSYWAVSTLNFIGGLDLINRTSLLSWVDQLRYSSGMYSNSLDAKPSILSTYRSTQIIRLLGGTTNATDNFVTEFLKYQTDSGGFVNTLDKTVPTMEATYFASLIAMNLGIELNWTKIREFVGSLKNPDGGYALRPAFSSRVSSSLYALQLLDALNGSAEVEVEGRTEDFFSPLIQVDFIPRLQNYEEVSGSYKIQAKVVDPEGGLRDSYVEVNWQVSSGVQNLRFEGTHQENGSWVYLFGPFTEQGIVEFRIVAVDKFGNYGYSEWYYLTSKSTLEGDRQDITQGIDFLALSLWLIYALAFFEGVYLFYTRRKINTQEVKDIFDNENQSNFNTLYLLIFMGIISTLARIYLSTGTQIFANSLLIFRFMVATVVILAAKYLIGLRSYGLFAPSVLVVSMIAVGPLWGTVIFANVFAIGYLARMLLDPYNLPVGFRIGILMLFNVASLGLLELIGEIYLIPVLSGSIFVPIIITPWIADRYVSQVKEYDHLHAFSRLVVTVGITLVAYLFMGNDSIVRFIALNPETWVILLFLLIKLSQLQKYSLFDKQRFKSLFTKSDDPLSISIRNRNYIAKYNAQILNPVINKYDMKMQFEKWNVPTPGVLAVLTELSDVDDLFDRIPNDPLFKKGFVIKPTQSLGGIGIIVVKEIEEGNYRVGSNLYSANALKRECRKIIMGEYLSSQTTSDNDIVLVEELIRPNERLSTISTGLPDIRVIVFRGIPVMAMARLPTSFSDGKANLKQGAIGAGIKISDGVIVHAEWKQLETRIHPDTKNEIVGFQIEKWNELLAIACLTQKSSALGYAGVDLVVDKSGEIYVLEINKRPGLEIQNINQASLMRRLELVEELDLDATGYSPLKSARLGKLLDSNDWDKEKVKMALEKEELE